jgi:hypothetical protein
MREVAAEFANPVMLYSVGKDSAVMLHLAMKAFYPSKPPFPLMHVNTTWKFKEMIQFRDETVKRLGLDFIEYINQDGVKRGINPFDSGSSLHTQVMKTEALKQALDKYGFDAPLAARAATRKRVAPRSASFRSALPPMPGTPRASGPNSGASTTRACQGRKHPCLPIVQLDRAGYLAIYPGRKHPDRAAVFRQETSGGGTRRHADHAR